MSIAFRALEYKADHMQSLLETYPKILAEAAITERLRRLPGIDLHPTLFNTPLIYEEAAGTAMAGLYRQYIDVAAAANLPLLLAAPTWRLDRERVPAAGVPSTIVRDAVAYLQRIRDDARRDGVNIPIRISGLLGPKGDCYRPEQGLPAAEAEDFHAWQIEELAAAGVDALLSQTMPAVDEALGMARAMARSGLPVLVSFCPNPRGELRDGTPLPEAVRRIDDAVSEPPLGYLVNCAYPTHLHAADQPPELFDRLIGIQANASSRDPAELEGESASRQDRLEDWDEAMLDLHRNHGMKILGGCCGTTDEHLRTLSTH